MQFDESFFEASEYEGFVTVPMVKRSWAAQMEVLEEIDKVCKQLGLRWYAAYGTLLGAVRHQGFIPWDDDLDIFMLREEYMRFMEEAPALLDAKWFEIKDVQTDPTHDYSKARVINGRHINFDPEFLERFHGCPYVCGVDIFPVDNIPDDEGEMRALAEALEFLLKVEASIPEEGPYDEDVLELMGIIEKKFGYPINYENRLRHEVKKVFDSLSRSYAHVPTKRMAHMMRYTYAYNPETEVNTYARGEWDEIVMLPFAGMEIPAPACYEKVLTWLYGANYMTPVNIGSSHNYPFYNEQIEGMRVTMEREFAQPISFELAQQLIEMKAEGV